MRFPARFLLLAAAALPLTPQNAKVQFHPLPAEVIQQRLAAVPYQEGERRALLESMFHEAGCDGDALTTLKVPHASPDLICTLPGTEPDAGAIVVGGHYDHASVGRGAVDDWSGAALLPSLYQSLKADGRRHRIVFIAFSAEETGLNGSAAYVRKLTKEERAEVRAMINLECLGLAPPRVWASRADKRLLSAYAAVAHAIGIDAAGMNVDQVGDDDSRPFLNAKIPVLTIHSVTQETLRILHSPGDQVAAIHPEDYFTTYKLAATYLAYLDDAL
ncbi:MAG: M28 family peptidase [Acidobacteria bacterium]|nr:M28 family peptidase [Acidobacteriota bacterium]